MVVLVIVAGTVDDSRRTVWALPELKLDFAKGFMIFSSGAVMKHSEGLG